MRVKIEVPSNWTKSDTHAFLRYIRPEPEDKEERDLFLVEEHKHHCWRNGGCFFWHQDGEEEYQGHCSLSSGECTTAAFNCKNPPSWLPKE